VRSADAIFDGISTAKPDASMIAIAEKIIEQREGPFDPSQFVDRYEQALKDMIAEKQKGHKGVAAAAAPEESNVVDLMAALRASLGGKEKAAPKPARGKKAREKRVG
jgi:DNA end-binding protein Ku